MSEDLIRRNDAIKVVRHSFMEFIDADTRQKLIEAIPTIEIPQTPKGDVIGYKWVLEWTLKPLPHTRVPQTQSIEPKLGRWIEVPFNEKCKYIVCSECGNKFTTDVIIPLELFTKKHKFCHNCGADMRERKGE